MRTALLASIVLAACGGGTSKPTEPPKATVWKDMNADQRMAYMKDVVLPESKKIFVAFDAKRYEKMDCVTCHGDSAANGSFEMPNAKIKPLPNSEEAFMAWIQKDPEAQKFTGFMSQQVEPLMGKLLGEPVFDPKTKTGELSCGTCHMLAAPDGTIAPMPGHEHHDREHHDGAAPATN
jgi:hypothetical protein